MQCILRASECAIVKHTPLKRLYLDHLECTCIQYTPVQLNQSCIVKNTLVLQKHVQLKYNKMTNAIGIV